MTAPPAPPPAAAAERCFDMSSFDRVRATRPDALYVRSGGRIFRVSTSPCPLMADPSSQVVLRERGSGPVCGPVDLELRVVGSGGAPVQTCAVRAVTPLSPAQAAALPSRDRP